MDQSANSSAGENSSNLGSTSRELVETTMKAIREWQDQKPGVISQSLGTLLSPLTWIVGKVVPQSAIEAVIGGADWAAKNITTSRSSGDLNDLASCNSNADSAINFHIAMAVAEGGAAGFFGIAALPADIPAVILLSLRLIRQVGIEYGYDGSSEDDRAFILSVLSASGANSQGEKLEAIALTSTIYNKIAKESWKSMAAVAATNKLGLDSVIITTKSLAKSLGINLTKRKALAAVPAIGAVVGGSVNGWYMREVGVAAQRSFQKRWLQDRDVLVDATIDN